MIAVMAETPVPVGRRIRLRRQALKWSQEELAGRLHVNRATVSAWERGRQLPERNEGAIEAVLGISLSQDEAPWYDQDDPVERAIAEDSRIQPEARRRKFVADLRAQRMEHVPRAHEPPA